MTSTKDSQSEPEKEYREYSSRVLNSQVYVAAHLLPSIKRGYHRDIGYTAAFCRITFNRDREAPVGLVPESRELIISGREYVNRVCMVPPKSPWRRFFEILKGVIRDA